MTDLFGTTTTVSTRKVSCQYPIMAITDMSPTHPLNQQNNSWTVIAEFPTNKEIEEKTKEKVYEASVWARKDEEIVFSAKFGRGSHMSVTWGLQNDSNDKSYTENDDCKTKSGSVPSFSGKDASVGQGAANSWCKFPFRYSKILFYGCSNFKQNCPQNTSFCSPQDPLDTVNLCATEIDEDYNAVKVGLCNEFCHVQGR